MLAHSTEENKDEANECCYRERERSEYACYTACLYHFCALDFRSVERDEMLGGFVVVMGEKACAKVVDGCLQGTIWEGRMFETTVVYTKEA